uniref:Uncharacterized protein n=1 Tax=Lepeophtheirus salmonis TaxID=72036 RepID=A0A0K2TXR2_LEPSM
MSIINSNSSLVPLNFDAAVNGLWELYIKRLGLPMGWKRTIVSSLRGINDGKKFTVQLQISTDCI